MRLLFSIAQVLHPLQFRDMFRCVSARLGAARLVLHEHVGKPAHAGVSKLQLAAMAEVLSEGELSATERADLPNAALACEWHGQDAMAVLTAMVPPESQFVKRSRVQQSYENIVAYGTCELWDDLVSDVSPAFKLQKILDLAFSLGLRCPTEPTIKLLTSWWVVSAETEAGIRRMTQPQKHVFLMHCKSEISRARKMCPESVVHLLKLPADPIVLLRDYPLLYQASFRHPAVPVLPRTDVHTIMAYDMSYSCRGSSKAKLQMEGSAASPASGSIDASLQKVTETLASQQQFLMQLVMAGGMNMGNMGGIGGMGSGMGMGGIQFNHGALGNGWAGGRQPRSLRALVNGKVFGEGADSPHVNELSTANRQGVLGDGTQILMQAAPQQAAPLQAAPLEAAPLQAAPLHIPSGSLAVAQPALTVDDHAINSMLDMFSERETERKAVAAATKATAKATAKAAAKAEADAKVEADCGAVAEPPLAIAAKAPAKAPSQAAGKAAGKVAAGKANPKAKAKPIGAPAVVHKVVSKISQHHRLLASMIGAHLHKSPAIDRFGGWSKAQSITIDCSLR